VVPVHVSLENNVSLSRHTGSWRMYISHLTRQLCFQSGVKHWDKDSAMEEQDIPR